LTRAATRPKSPKARAKAGPKGKPQAAHSALFIREFLARPFLIGAVAPSSPHLARKMVEGVDFRHTRTVVEFGPGTGSFTSQILQRLQPDSRYLAIELSTAMATAWRKRYPKATLYQGSVAQVDRICKDEGIEQVDVIFSGLPWASFDDDLQEEILDASLRVLKPGGQLITFGYQVGTMLPKGRRFYRRLPRYFSSVERSDYVWLNVPPAFVVRCTK
jgi:phosphatidylethanolamine/phosphatidyl-N-methylethanolamine N-methyltransferase